MTFTHINPGNIVRWNGKFFIVIEAARRLIKTVSFTNSADKRRFNSQTNPPPVMVSENAADHVIDLVTRNY